MKDAPAFDFYPERWSQGTRHMSKVERCDYLDLLGYQWTNDGVPANLKAVATILGYRKEAQIPASVIEKFPVAGDGMRRNKRLEAIREEQRGRILANSFRQSRAAFKKHHPADPYPPHLETLEAFEEHRINGSGSGNNGRRSPAEATSGSSASAPKKGAQGYAMAAPGQSPGSPGGDAGGMLEEVPKDLPRQCPPPTTHPLR